ncbi:MAG TPA: nicotinamide riboside transporter PnuC [Gammaproteobacteria bacterium]|nr:nicotinamide riboside transporter PnuC [Gammaproteobacteria bacterium]
MRHWIDVAAAVAASASPLEAASVVFGVLYLWLAIRENIWCWAAGLVGVLLSLVLFWERRLYMDSLLQVFYAVMSVYGWYEWRYGGKRGEGVPIQVWTATTHAAALTGIALLTAAFGLYLHTYTNDAMPFVDSFTTIGALVTTYMVAKKVLENWVYWLVIDAVSAAMYVSRGLYLYAALFAVYLVMVVIGLRAWTRQWRAEQGAAAMASSRPGAGDHPRVLAADPSQPPAPARASAGLARDGR